MISNKNGKNGKNGDKHFHEHSPFEDLLVEQRQLLAAYTVLGRMRDAIEQTETSPYSHAKWMSTDRKYRNAYRIAERISAQNLEDEARRRAEEGLIRHKFHNGEMIYVPQLDRDGIPIRDEKGRHIMIPYIEREYSDSLMLALLKGALPKKYRERRDVKVSVNNQERVAGLTQEEARKQLLDRLKMMLPSGDSDGA